MMARRHEMFENRPVTQSSRHVQDANMATNVQIFHLEYTGLQLQNENSWIFMGMYVLR